MHEGLLFVAIEVARAAGLIGRAPVVARDAELTERNHVAIGPRTLHVRLFHPFAGDRDQVSDVVPRIPNIIHHAPHIRMVIEVSRLSDWRLAGRGREDDLPSIPIDCVAEHLNFARVIGGCGKIVALDEVHGPFGVEVDDGVVILLGARATLLNRAIVAQPGAFDLAIADLIARNALCSLDREFAPNGFFRHAAHDVNTEFEPLRMDVVRERLESLALGRGRETVRRRDVATPLVQRINRVLLVVARIAFVLNGPADVDNANIIPILEQVFGLPIGIGANLCFIDDRAVTIPAIPAHWGCRRPVMEIGISRRDAEAGKHHECE